MGTRSFLLAAIVSFLLAAMFLTGISSSDSWLNKLSAWAGFTILIIFGLCYLVAIYYGIRGFRSQPVLSLAGIGLSILGIGYYILAISMSTGKGKAVKGQYDYTFITLDPNDKDALLQFASENDLTIDELTFTETWNLFKNDGKFLITSQKNHVTGLSVSGKKISSLAPLNSMNQLQILYLNNCALKDCYALMNENITRLEMPNNKITDLQTLKGCPNLEWMMLPNNDISSMDDIGFFSKLKQKDLSGNPVAGNSN